MEEYMKPMSEEDAFAVFEAEPSGEPECKQMNEEEAMAVFADDGE